MFMKFVQENDILRKLIMGSRKLIESFAPDLMHIADDELSASINLARHEHYTIGQDSRPINVPNEMRDKITLISVPKDNWCTPEVVKALQIQVKHMQVTEPHAFVVSSAHRKSLFQRIILDRKNF